MSYETCNNLYPSTPCPYEYEGGTLYNWTATTPYPSTCTYNLREVMGVIMGMLSIVCWIMVAIPQLWVNYVLKKADGLSIFFILQWFAADACNLAGALVTKQVSSQIYLAIWYVIQDTMMFAQYLYYSRLNAKITDVGNLEDATLPPDETTKLVPASPVAKPSQEFLERNSGNSIGSGSSEQPHSHARNITYETPADVAGSADVSPGDVRRMHDAGQEPGMKSPATNHRIGTFAMATRKTSSTSLQASYEAPNGFQQYGQPRRSRDGLSPASATKSPGSVKLRAVLVMFGVSSLVFGSGMMSHVEEDAAVAHAGRATMRRVLQVEEAAESEVVDLEDIYGAHKNGSGHRKPRTDAPKSHSSSAENIYDVGIGLGWLSAVLYLGSRIPQLWKNMKRKSTDGLSPLMFTMAVGGNVTYFLSFFLITPTRQGMICHLPWVVGSLGTIFFDASALVQFLWYRARSNELLEEAVGDEEKSGVDSIRLPGTSRASVARRNTLTGIRAPKTTPRTQASESEVSVYPLALPPSVYAGSIRNGYYGRIGIWYNE